MINSILVLSLTLRVILCFLHLNIFICLYPSAEPKKQLELAVKAVFDSWDSPRAIKYRSINQITGLKGTAVNIQCMVFGNMGNTSGTGVLFTRNPSTGEKKLYGEFLINAQVSIISFLLIHFVMSLLNWLFENINVVEPINIFV